MNLRLHPSNAVSSSPVALSVVPPVPCTSLYAEVLPSILSVVNAVISALSAPVFILPFLPNIL